MFSSRLVLSLPKVVTLIDGSSNVIYENGTAKRLLTDEGYVDLTTNTYYYYMKDHQGNNRAVVNSSGIVQETNHYYPFGGLFSTSTNVQPYKYNGKELDTKKGLNLYDYGARHYDAALGRWHVVDPLAEKYYSLGFYIYCANNPIKYIDPQGTDIYGFDINTGRLSIIKQTEDDFDRINLGVFDDNNNFSVTDSNTFLDINKGVLFGEYFDDISKSGIIFTEGFVNEGINTMKFLSFNLQYPHYILSKKDGIVQYFQNGTMKKTYIK